MPSEKIALFVATKLELDGLGQVPASLEPFIHGPGIISSLYHIISYLEHEKPKAVVQAGIAGAYPDTGLQVGDLVQVVSETIYPYGIEESDGSLTPLWEKDFFTDFNFSKGTLRNPNTYPDIEAVESITTFKTSGTESTVQEIRQLFPQVQIENMEGFALFYACQAMHIPFLEIRSVSNLVEKRNPARWDIPLALKKIGSFLQENHSSIQSLLHATGKNGDHRSETAQ